MIMAGIDEAGLGPAMGPLAVCLAAMRVPDPCSDEQPWQALEAAVSRTRSGNPDRLLVTDSKIAYNGKDLAPLERTVMAFMTACKAVQPGDKSTNFNTILEKLGCGDTLLMMSAIPWYNTDDQPVPRSTPLSCLAGDAATLQDALAAAGMSMLCLRARLCPALYLNRKFAQGLNKAEALMAEVACHLQHVSRFAQDEPVRIIVDKLGGRNKYLPFLMQVFPGEWIQTITEGAQASEYFLPYYQASIRIRFMVKADKQAFMVALASMLAKFLRERCMEQFNTFFARHLPGLKPTAGYHGDAPRFLAEVEDLTRQLAIDRDLLVRQR